MKFVKMTMTMQIQTIQQVPNDFVDEILTGLTEEQKQQWSHEMVMEFQQDPNTSVLNAKLDKIEIVTV